MKFPIAVLCGFALLILPCQIEAQDQKSAQESQESVRSLAEDFYRWYVPKVVQPTGGWDLALKYKAKVFSRELFRPLKQDSDAQEKTKDEIVGLDFDPFLNTQDPCDRYEVGAVVAKGEIFRVEVFGVCGGKKNEKPDVIAEVGRQNGHWVFTNFVHENLAKQFPDSADLLRILKRLHQQRGGSKRKP